MKRGQIISGWLRRASAGSFGLRHHAPVYRIQRMDVGTVPNILTMPLYSYERGEYSGRWRGVPRCGMISFLGPYGTE